MSKLNMYKKIKSFLNSLKCREKGVESPNGFQLSEADLGDYLSSFLSKQQKESMLKNINSVGYLSYETGAQLKAFFNNPDYDLYIKSVHDSFVESIFNEGIRCYGNTSVLATTNPQSLDEVSLENTVTKMDLFPMLISNIKNNNGMSQGFSTINGTLIIMIPKNTPKEEILYFNAETKTYNIKPIYVVGFLPVDENNMVKDWVFNGHVERKNYNR